jgi:hypothetical protein
VCSIATRMPSWGVKLEADTANREKTLKQGDFPLRPFRAHAPLRVVSSQRGTFLGSFASMTETCRYARTRVGLLIPVGSSLFFGFFSRRRFDLADALTLSPLFRIFRSCVFPGCGPVSPPPLATADSPWP